MKKVFFGLLTVAGSASLYVQNLHAQDGEHHNAIAANEHMAGNEQERHIHPWVPEYNEMMVRMHGPMMDGILAEDPDEAFVRGMIPHHQGAIDMAHTQLKYGKDPTIRQLARDIIAAQEKEIALMNAWLAPRKESDE